MRSIKDRVREIKKILRACLPNDQEKIRELEQELKILKEQWDGWEKSRQEAVRERMIYLGHEEPYD
jgi:flagellin-specific chaperone FliS